MNMNSEEYQRLKQIVEENEGITAADAVKKLHQ